MFHRFLAALAFVVFLPGAAAAQDWYDGIYVELRGGVVFLNDSDVESDDLAAAGLSDAEFEADIGWSVESALGYAHDSGFRGEIALGYRQNELDEASAKFSGVTVSGDIDGDISLFTALANGYYDFHLDRYGTQGPLGNLVPFIGGGLGVGLVDTDGDDVGGATDTVFAYQGVAGLYYGITPNVGVSVSYAYFATTDIKEDGVEADYSSHNVLAGLRYSF